MTAAVTTQTVEMTTVEARISLETKNWATTRSPRTTPARRGLHRWRTVTSWTHSRMSGGNTTNVRLRWPTACPIS